MHLTSILFSNALSIADITNPVVINLTPSDNATGVGVDDNLLIQFDENVTLVNSNGVTLHKTSDDSSVSATVTANTDTVTINPTSSLDNDTGYYVLVDSAAIDDMSGNSFAGTALKTAYNFTTEVGEVSDTTNPTISSLNPTDNATGVSVSASLSITFDENVTLVNSNGVTLHKTSDDSSVSAIASINNDVLLINPDSNLDYSTSYYINISATAIDDTSGNSFAGVSNKTDYNFTTASSSSFAISSSSPSDGGTNVDVNNAITITFNENVVLLDHLGFKLYKTSDDSIVSCAVTASGAVVTMQPIGTMYGSTSYYILIESDAIEDIYDNTFAGISSKTELNFTTESASLPSQSDDEMFHDLTYVNTPDFSALDLTARVLNKDYVCIVIDPSPFILQQQKAHAAAWMADKIPNSCPAYYTQTSNFGLMWLFSQYNYVPEMVNKMRDASYWSVNSTKPTTYGMWPQVVSNRSFNIENDYSDAYSGSMHTSRMEFFKSGSACDYGFYCYIKTPSSMVDGNSYTFEDYYGNSVVVNYSDSDSHSWAFKVNQLGYVRTAKKYAYLGSWMGPDLNGLDFSGFSGDTFHLRKVSDDSSVYNSTIAYRMDDTFKVISGDSDDINAVMQNVTGEYKQYQMDFSSYTTAGEYYLQVDGIGKSWPFKIDTEANVYGDLFYFTNRSLMYQRGHANITSTHTEWPFNSNYLNYKDGDAVEFYKCAKAPSLELANNDVSSNGNWGWYDETDSKWYEDWTISKFGGGHEYQMDYFEQASIDVAPESDVKLTGITGGLMDAADTDRRRYHLRCTTYPSIAYLLDKTKYSDNQLNIPESGDGTPDILSNIEHGVEWIKDIQDSLGTGAVMITAEQSTNRRGDYYTTAHIKAALTEVTDTVSKSMAINTDEKTFTISTGLSLKADQWGHYKAVLYVDDDNYIGGWLKSYSSSTGEAVFVPYADMIEGSGTYSSWNFFQSESEYESLAHRFYTGEPTRIGCLEYAYTAALFGKALLEAGKTTLGNSYIDSAEDAYDWAEAQSQIVMGTTVRDGHTVRWYGPSNTDGIYKHSQMWATIALRIATGDSSYLTELNSIGDTYFESDANSIASGCKNNPQGYHYQKNCIDLAIVSKYSSSMPAGWGTYVDGKIEDAADAWIDHMDYNMYRQPWKAEGVEWNGSEWVNRKSYTGDWVSVNWGWRSSAVMAILFTAYELSGTAKYKEYGLYGLDYYLGCNPKGRSQYSGIGHSSLYWWLFNFPKELYTRGEYPRGYEIYGGNMSVSGFMAVASWQSSAGNCFAYRDYSKTGTTYSVTEKVFLPKPYDYITTYDYDNLRSKFSYMMPYDRRHYCNESNEVTQNEFTCWETQVYGMYCSAMIIGTGYTPSTAIKTQARRTEAEMFDSRFFMP